MDRLTEKGLILSQANTAANGIPGEGTRERTKNPLAIGPIRSLEDAAKYGINGRILWAMAILGKGPRIERVYHASQLPYGMRDSASAFAQAIKNLVRIGSIKELEGDRLDLTRKIEGSPNYVDSGDTPAIEPKNRADRRRLEKLQRKNRGKV